MKSNDQLVIKSSYTFHTKVTVFRVISLDASSFIASLILHLKPTAKYNDSERK